MRNVALLDTSAATDNLGDEIIVEAVRNILFEVLPDAYLYRIATHEYMTGVSKKLISKSDFAIVAGTNIISSKMGSRSSLWKLRPWDVFSLRECILLGVGWRGYMAPPSRYSSWMLRQMLANKFVHSVRDDYTKLYLQRHGIYAENTSCPTMWMLTPEHCARIPATKAANVVTALTYYYPNPRRHRAFLELLKKHYKNVFFWPQQSDDFAYFQSLRVSGVNVVPPSLRHYDMILGSENLDYIGSRLHGGIRALQKGRRSLILKVDNRAAEIALTTDLPVEDDDDNLEQIENWITGVHATSIILPTQSIERWKAQFNTVTL